MKYPTRIYYTDDQKKMMWDRWQKGDSMHTIARLFNRGHSSVQGILSKMGGVPPVIGIGSAGWQVQYDASHR